MDAGSTTYRYVLTDTGNGGILKAVNGYIFCPICGRKKIGRIYNDTFCRHIGLWCRNCGTVNIDIFAVR